MTEEQKERKRAVRKLRESSPAWREKARAYAKEYRLKNLDQFRGYDRKRRTSQNRITYQKKYLKEYSERNKAALSSYKKQWCELNQDRLIAKKRIYYQENKRTLLERQKERLRSLPESKRKELFKKQYLSSKSRLNPERIERRRKSYRRRYHSNPEYYIQRVNKWREKHPERVKSMNHKRRMLQSATCNGTAETFIKHVRSLSVVGCYYCKTKIRGVDAHIDHIVALSKGGNHCSSNLCASCMPCNVSKHNKSLREWKKFDQELLEL